MPGEENKAKNLTSMCTGLSGKAKHIPASGSALIYHFSLRSSECTDKPFTAGPWMHLVWEAKSQLCFYSMPPLHYKTYTSKLQALGQTWAWSIDLIENSAGIRPCQMAARCFFFIFIPAFYLVCCLFSLGWIISTFCPPEKYPLIAMTSCLKGGGAEQKSHLLWGTVCYCAQLLIAANMLFQCRFLFLGQWESVIIREARRAGFAQAYLEKGKGCGKVLLLSSTI